MTVAFCTFKKAFGRFWLADWSGWLGWRACLVGWAGWQVGKSTAVVSHTRRFGKVGDTGSASAIGFEFAKWK